MNKEFLSKLKELAEKTAAEKELINELYEQVWNRIMEQYRIDYLKDVKEGEFFHRVPEYYSDNMYPVIESLESSGKLTEEGVNELFSRLREDGFDDIQLPDPERIIWKITPEKVDEIINSAMTSKDIARK